MSFLTNIFSIILHHFPHTAVIPNYLHFSECYTLSPSHCFSTSYSPIPAICFFELSLALQTPAEGPSRLGRSYTLSYTLPSPPNSPLAEFVLFLFLQLSKFISDTELITPCCNLLFIRTDLQLHCGYWKAVTTSFTFLNLETGMISGIPEEIGKKLLLKDRKTLR